MKGHILTATETHLNLLFPARANCVPGAPKKAHSSSTLKPLKTLNVQLKNTVHNRLPNTIEDTDESYVLTIGDETNPDEILL